MQITPQAIAKFKELMMSEGFTPIDKVEKSGFARGEERVWCVYSRNFIDIQSNDHKALTEMVRGFWKECFPIDQPAPKNANGYTYESATAAW